MSSTEALSAPDMAGDSEKRDLIDGILAEAVRTRAVPFVVAMAGTSGGLTYAGAAGDLSSGRPAKEDTLFRLFSMTKAIGQVCAMIMNDRGKLDFETPVEDILPEFSGIQVVDGFEGDMPILRPPRVKATIRHLATHTSGLVYDTWSPPMTRYAASSGYPGVMCGTRECLSAPLMFDPGTRWHYGFGTDWLGLVVEQVAGMPIDRFVQDEILDPLGMTGTMFDLRPDAHESISPLISLRDPNGQFLSYTMDLPVRPEFYSMSQALHGTAPDYLRFLRMLLNKGTLDGARILREETVDRMFRNAIGDLSVGRFPSISAFARDMDFFPDTPKTHSLFGVRTEQDLPGMRRAGSQFWAGFANTHFWIDPASDVAAVFLTQSLPFADEQFMDAFAAFERAVYAG